MSNNPVLLGFAQGTGKTHIEDVIPKRSMYAIYVYIGVV